MGDKTLGQRNEPVKAAFDLPKVKTGTSMATLLLFGSDSTNGM